MLGTLNNNNNIEDNINFNNIKTICRKFSPAEYIKVKERLIDGKARRC